MYDLMMVTEIPRIKKENFYSTAYNTFYIKAVNPGKEEPVCIECVAEYNNSKSLALYKSCIPGDIIQVNKEVDKRYKQPSYAYSIIKNISAEKRLAEFNKNYPQLCKEHIK